MMMSTGSNASESDRFADAACAGSASIVSSRSDTDREMNRFLNCLAFFQHSDSPSGKEKESDIVFYFTTSNSLLQVSSHITGYQKEVRPCLPVHTAAREYLPF